MTKQQKFALLTLTILGLTVFPAQIASSGNQNLFFWGSVLAQNAPSANRQRFSTEGVWRKVYELLPDLPQENQYISKETGKQATENTLVGRLIRYHMFVKGRPPIFRLDWKLTIADYLGINEIMYDNVYPGGDTLRQNPIDRDRAAIRSLTRTQRNALVNTLVSIFNPNPAAPSQPTLKPAPTPTPSPNPDTSVPSPPQPGDAQRLKLL